MRDDNTAAMLSPVHETILHAAWGFVTANECNSLKGAIGQLASSDIRTQCQYTDTAIGIGLVFLAIDAILGIGGIMSKEEQEEQTTY